jgi:transcriptional regulator with XRE-family HTH domain
MSRFSDIRALLGMTQQEMAEVLGCVPSNVSFLDRGQTITPAVANKLVDAAAALGVQLTFNDIYGTGPLPPAPRRKRVTSAKDWRQVLQDLYSSGWTPLELAVHLGVRLAVIRALQQGELEDAPHAIGAALLAVQPKQLAKA